MPDTGELSTSTVYQLWVVLTGISPLIWRLLVSADTSIAGLHAVLQVAFGWQGEHLHRFVIHGREYGIASGRGPVHRRTAAECGPSWCRPSLITS